MVWNQIELNLFWFENIWINKIFNFHNEKICLQKLEFPYFNKVSASKSGWNKTISSLNKAELWLVAI